MNKLMVVLALVVMGGCMAGEEQGVADDVASQESTVESAPALPAHAPVPEDNLINRSDCSAWCVNQWGDDMEVCWNRFPGGGSSDPHHPGPGTPGFWRCSEQADANSNECDRACDTIFGGL